MNLYNADLTSATLKGTVLTGAILDCAILSEANLESALLSYAYLRGTILRDADLESADLRYANLTSADLRDATIKDALLLGARVTDAIFAPVSVPSSDYVAAIEGLDAVTFPAGRQDGLVRLRELLREAGLRDAEREVTYAIESRMARHAIESTDVLRKIDGVARVAFFEYTTMWGREPSRALLMIVIVWIAATFFYWLAILPGDHWLLIMSERRSDIHGIYKVWIGQRLEPQLQGKVTMATRAQRVCRESWASMGWALYFSLLSAFQIGWRDVNLSTWITRMQYGEFLVRGHGWVRTVAGIQSLLSVYLLAIWALTYFGRPFN